MNNRSTLLTALTILGILTMNPIWAFSQTNAKRWLTDLEIRPLVAASLTGNDILDVDVDVHNGVVTLRGMVPSLYYKEDAVALADQTPGVRSVVDELTVPAVASDTDIQSQFDENLRSYLFYTVFDYVDGAVKNGAVTLTGWVTEPYKSRSIYDLAARVQGVQNVVNHIQVLPPSQIDSQLRAEVAERIYRHNLFWDMAIKGSPSIHVVVENGVVRLAGHVKSDEDKREAGVIAGSVLGATRVENDLAVSQQG